VYEKRKESTEERSWKLNEQPSILKKKEYTTSVTEGQSEMTGSSMPSRTDGQTRKLSLEK